MLWKFIVFETYFIKLLLKYIVLPYEWNIFDKKRSMFESKNECLIKNLKGFRFEILFLTFKIIFWLKKSFFDKNSFDHNSYDFLSIWDVIGTDRRGILLRFFLAYFYQKNIQKKWLFFLTIFFINKKGPCGSFEPRGGIFKKTLDFQFNVFL